MICYFSSFFLLRHSNRSCSSGPWTLKRCSARRDQCCRRRRWCWIIDTESWSAAETIEERSSSGVTAATSTSRPPKFHHEIVRAQCWFGQIQWKHIIISDMSCLDDESAPIERYSQASVIPTTKTSSLLGINNIFNKKMSFCCNTATKINLNRKLLSGCRSRIYCKKLYLAK